MPKGEGRDPRGSEDEGEVGKVQYADRDTGEGAWGRNEVFLGDRENAEREGLPRGKGRERGEG